MLDSDPDDPNAAIDPRLLSDPSFNPLKTANTDPPADPALRRHCPVRLLIPTQETSSPTPTWTDVAFAYVRELAKTELAPLIKIASGDFGGVDLRGASAGTGSNARPASRWYPYAHGFYGICPRPGTDENGRGCKPTFVNVVIGAGDLTENLWTFGSVNVLVTGYAIPPYKVGWLPARAWDYDYVVMPSEKHTEKFLLGTPIPPSSDHGRSVHTIPPRDGVPALVGVINQALGLCVPESERVYE